MRPLFAWTRGGGSCVLWWRSLQICTNHPGKGKVLTVPAAATNFWLHTLTVEYGHITGKSNGSVKEPNMVHNYETEKITRKASDAAENLQLYRVIQFFRWRSSCTTYLMLFSERPPIYATCVMHDHLGWKNRTTRYNRFWRAGCSQLGYVDIRSVY